MHCQDREKSILSHLKFVKCLNGDYSFDALKSLVDNMLYVQALSPNYTNNVLYSINVRHKLAPEVFKKILRYIGEQKRKIDSSSLAYEKNEKFIYDREGNCCTYENTLGVGFTNVFQKKQYRELPILTLEQADQILNFTKLRDEFHELYLLLRIMWANGARMNEVFRLKDPDYLNDVLATCKMHISGKTREKQYFCLDKHTVSIIEKYQALYKLPLFKKTPRTYLNQYHNVLKLLNMKVKPEIRIWRNLFALRCSRVDINICRDVLNHSNLSMTKHYVMKAEASDYQARIDFLNRLNSSK